MLFWSSGVFVAASPESGSTHRRPTSIRVVAVRALVGGLTLGTLRLWCLQFFVGGCVAAASSEEWFDASMAATYSRVVAVRENRRQLNSLNADHITPITQYIQSAAKNDPGRQLAELMPRRGFSCDLPMVVTSADRILYICYVSISHLYNSLHEF